MSVSVSCVVSDTAAVVSIVVFVPGFVLGWLLLVLGFVPSRVHSSLGP